MKSRYFLPISLILVHVLGSGAQAQTEPPPVPAAATPVAPTGQASGAHESTSSPADILDLEDDATLPAADPPPETAGSDLRDPEEVLPPGMAGDARDGVAVDLGPPSVVGLDASRGAPASVLDLPGIAGAVGLLRLATANAGRPKQLRLGLSGEFFAGSEVLVQQDQNLRLRGGFFAGYTPIENLDVFFGISGSANRNKRLCNAGVCVSEPNRVDPEVIKSLGDVTLGGKYTHELTPGLTVGGLGQATFYSSVTGVAFDAAATSLALSGLASMDVGSFIEGLPLRVHGNAGFVFDNSGNLQDYANTPPASKLVSTFAYGIGRDRFTGAVAVDVPLPNLAEGFQLLPFVEYHTQILPGGADRSFREYAPPACRTNGVACKNNRDMHWLALGAKALISEHFALTVAVEASLRSVGFTYGAPQAPYNVVLGVATPLDLGVFGRPRIVTRTVTVEKNVTETPQEGVAMGRVVNAADQTPLAGAIVAIVGRAMARVATDPDGTFRSHRLAPGEMDVAFSAPGFESQIARIEIAAGMSTELEIALIPRQVEVSVTGRVNGTDGTPLAGRVFLTGGETLSGDMDASGRFDFTVPPGPYTVTVQSPGHLARAQKIQVEGGRPATLAFTLVPAPTPPTVTVQDGGLVLGRVIRFGTGSDLTDRSKATIAEIADLMLRSPDVNNLVVETHWDSSVGSDKAMALTEKQADLIIAQLHGFGVERARLQAAPRGAAQPIVPNIGANNRRKNQRVVFRIER